MTSYDLITAAADNLWRMKLRSVLTMAGVLIAIAAFVSMLSFGAGNQQYVNDQFEKFGLLTTMQVFPEEDKNGSDSVKAKVLNDSALAMLAQIPGVRLAYPLEAFEIEAKLGDSTATLNAQAISSEVARTAAMSQYLAGTRFENDSSRQVVVTRDFVKRMGITDADSAVGRELVVTARLIRIDSAWAAIISDKDGAIRKRLRGIDRDSIFEPGYAMGLLRRETSEALRRFYSGLMNNRELVTETLTISGVIPGRHESPMRIEQVILPLATARRLNDGDISMSPASLMSSFSSGSLPDMFAPKEVKSYSKVTLDFDPHTPFKSVRDSVKALGFKTYSFAEQFEEIQKMFIYFDMALGMIGLIALVTASLGIANTMIMSILERRREIGVLKALGADDSDIRRIFLYEAAAIGTLGATFGIIVGWGIARVASFVAQSFMRREGVEAIELFATPWWLIGIALGFGIVVSLLAGYYPARRAARLDPVESLRNE